MNYCWSTKEHFSFCQGLELYNSAIPKSSKRLKWKIVSGIVKTRTPEQCKTHQKVLQRNSSKQFISKRGNVDFGRNVRKYLQKYRAKLQSTSTTSNISLEIFTASLEYLMKSADQIQSNKIGQAEAEEINIEKMIKTPFEGGIPQLQ